jgi:hypothetical protein
MNEVYVHNAYVRGKMKHTIESLEYADYPIIMLMHDAESILVECGTQEDRHPILPRAAVSVLFAGIEGSVFVLKQMFRDVRELNESLRPEDLGFLGERVPSAYLNDNGTVAFKDAKIPLETNVRFLERISNEVLGMHLDIVNSGHWDDFKDAVKVRGRVTHPRNADDMEISEAELKLMTRVFSTFVDFFGDIITGLKASNKRSVATP